MGIKESSIHIRSEHYESNLVLFSTFGKFRIKNFKNKLTSGFFRENILQFFPKYGDLWINGRRKREITAL